MKSLFVNSVRLMGYVGLNPEVKHFENGSMVARVRVATNENYKDKNGERVEYTEWHTLTFRGKKAEVIENYLHKGDQLMVEGKLRNRTYTDKDGQLRYYNEIEVNDFQFLPKAGKTETSENTATKTVAKSNKSAKMEDNLPF